MFLDFSKLPPIDYAINFINEAEMDPGYFISGMATFLLILGLYVLGVSGSQVLSVFLFLAPIWLPLILFLIFFNKWMDMVGKDFYLKSGRVTLRLKLPPEVLKSPEAMEFVLGQIHNVATPDNLMQTYLQGKRPLNMGLEIVSIGGEVRFYVNCKVKQTKNAIEAHLYAQYPGIEVVEEPVDYAAEIPLDTDKYDMMMFHMNKKGPQEFPLKTYVDYGLKDMPKEEEKVDSITPMLEFLSNVQPHERLYIQFIVSSHRKKDLKRGNLKAAGTWEVGVHEKIDELMQRDSKTKGPLNAGDESDFTGMPRITSGEREQIEAMERNAEKAPYDTNIRWVYLVEKGKFNGDIINPTIKTFSQVDRIGCNQIGVRWRTDFNYMFLSDPTGKHVEALKRQEFKEFKLRKFFPKNTIGYSKVFTVEELATLFHIPGKVATTPTLERIQSNKSEAPSNLPIGNLPI